MLRCEMRARPWRAEKARSRDPRGAHVSHSAPRVEQLRLTQGAPFSTSEAWTTESRSTYLTPFMARIASTVDSENDPA